MSNNMKKHNYFFYSLLAYFNRERNYINAGGIHIDSVD
ncbi:hypothetical protein yrohd0001_24400 [Yersinia rohdei ATCC 43380]|nr:hypothetical protein yrohd0001_24400 [Yersinia rohdei ATCC 43380]